MTIDADPGDRRDAFVTRQAAGGGVATPGAAATVIPQDRARRLAAPRTNPAEEPAPARRGDASAPPRQAPPPAPGRADPTPARP